MANQVANRSDFLRLHDHVRAGILAVLETCTQHRMSVRCEMLGRDFTVIIGKGYSSPAWWLDYLQTSEDSAQNT